jgi:signal transduction histidine kinase
MTGTKMKATAMRTLTVILAVMACIITAGKAWAQGIPYFHNFTATEYKAHNMNFDIVAGEDGTVYVANFEGLLYFDNSQWRIIHTQGINRITALFMDSKGKLWTGGYNYIGYLENSSNGTPELKEIGREKRLTGEVTRMWEDGSQMYMLMSDNNIYAIDDSTLTTARNVTLPQQETEITDKGTHVSQVLKIDGGPTMMVTNGEGVVIADKNGKEICRITEDNGLCSGNVSRICYNNHGLLWGATDNGIFAIEIPSIYTRFTPTEGLRGEVLCMETLGDNVYVGTLSGLYCLKGKKFVQVKDISLACWQLAKQGDRLLAATSSGTYAIDKEQKVKYITTTNTLSLLVDGNDSFYSGEMDGVYHNESNGRRTKTWDVEKVVRMVRDDNGTVWLRSIYGSIWKTTDGKTITTYDGKEDNEQIRAMVYYKGKVTTVGADDKKPFPYPLFSYADDKGLLWLTDNKGRQLFAMQDSTIDERMSCLVYPLMDYSVRAMMRIGEQLWMGGDKGINVVDNELSDPVFDVTPRLYIRSVSLFGDSIVWGGYGDMPATLPILENHQNHIVFHFAIDYPSLLLNTQYRTRLNEGNWSAWETLTFEEYSNLTHGNYRFEVQARDAYGRISETVAMNFSIRPPLYLRWYMIALYVLLAALTIYAMVRLRLRQLEKDKRRLETIVQERTAEVVKQKDEIEQKSRSLETALHELGEAQHELVRQEKMATVGKLTQGLIDRILNPLNYINNFAKLSESLIGDVKANIEDEKENISPDNYDDTMEVLDMLKGNLEKVGVHGANTSRTLKAMEELLKDRSGGQTTISLTVLLRQDEKMLRKYYEKEIAENNISVIFDLPDNEVEINANPDQLSKTIMSLVCNAIYAVVKKRLRQQNTDYHPEVSLVMTTSENMVYIKIRDNGTGIDGNIIDRIFDPFFTTKTTGEASGVGLYLSREIAQNHGGDISVKSEKGVFTEFTITLPITTNNSQ